MKKVLIAMLVLTALAVTASAQQVPTYTFERKAAADQSAQVLLDKVKLEQAQVAVMSKAVPNAPYSAETTSESIQVLQDGNRIVKRSVTRVYRDSAGRTRKEILDNDGQVTTVFITDPTTGASTVFDARGNTVSNSTVRVRSGSAQAGTVAAGGTGGASAVWIASAEKAKVEAAAAAAQPVIKERVAVGGGGVAGGIVYAPAARGETTKEDLGQQVIEGVTANGTRTTTVIAAGVIGNEQPIRIVSEEWFSPELQVLVLTRHSDPRTGETTYRVTGINRTEPPKVLFEAPAK